ncbi:hypothetical protein ACFV9D_16155 [Streptomyces sp. NPDC059875]|uniref:hypothetical protein n=1 Tax=unclassified Streptomyces TaxID=2593676 RepID=UPI003656D28E
MPELQELFDMRLAALDLDVRKVKAAATEASRRRKMVDELIRRIGGMTGTSVTGNLRDADATVTKLTKQLKYDEDLREIIEDRDLRGEIEALPQQIQFVWDAVVAAGRTLTRIERTMVQIEPRTFEASLSTRCNDCSEKIAKLRRSLRSGAAPRNIWGDLEALIEDQCQPLFADYVDLLGGLTLRDTDLDDRVCDITDTLLAEVAREPYTHLLAVPSRRATLPGPLDFLIKLGFPEWTIWNVPLVGHEIGLDISRISSNVGIIDDLKEAAPDHSDDFLRHLFADSIAAYSIGPAFCCAAVLMRFQPDHDAQNTHTPTDVERAFVIHRTLQRMDSAKGSFAGAVEKVNGYWTEAVRHLVGGRALAPAPPWLHDFEAKAFRLLERRVLVAPYGPEQWENLRGLKAQLLSPPEPPRNGEDSEPAPRHLGPVLDLLNAAWWARLDDPDKTDRIAGNVKRMWQGRPARKTGPSVPQRNTQPPTGGRHGYP